MIDENRNVSQKFKRWIESNDGPWCVQYLKNLFNYEGPTYQYGENFNKTDLVFAEGGKEVIRTMLDLAHNKVIVERENDNTQD